MGNAENYAYAFFVVAALFSVFDGTYILEDSHGPAQDVAEKSPTEKFGVYVINLDRVPECLVYVMPSIHRLSLFQ